MTAEPTPSRAASLWALVLALMVAGLVFGCDWTPWQAVVLVGGSALLVAFVGIIGMVAMTRSRNDRTELWKLMGDTARADLQPFVVLWRFLRGHRR
jgi:hypothetical protein